MPTRCVVGGCSNTAKDGVSLHTFPKDKKMRRIWTRFVQTTRSDFREPSDSSVVCSAHFTEDCYDPAHQIKKSLGIPFRKDLLPDKYPTMKKSQSSTIAQQQEMDKDQPGTSKSTSNVATAAEGSAGSNVRRTSSAMGDEAGGTGPVKKPRLSSEKRAAKKLVGEIISIYEMQQSQPEEEVAPSPDIHETSQENRGRIEKYAQTDVTVLPTKVKKRSRRVQCYPQGSNKGTQTEIEREETAVVMKVAEVQCTILTGDGDTEATEDERDEDTAEQDDVELAKEEKDEDYQPSDSPRSSSDSESTSDAEEKKLWEENKFIVFQSCLLSLFTVCMRCQGATQAVISQILGTMIVITQTCMTCSWENRWSSQPLIKDVPAGNLLLSGAVLFSGASPTKTLRVLSHMRCKVHDIRTYYRHQSKYLQPAVFQLWESKQHQVISDLMVKDKPLVLGGDSRSDSPGHTAKFGSYTLMEMQERKILHLELVQKNEVTSSNAMELEGLKRSMKWMLDAAVMADLAINCIITDRHLQVAKWIRENLEKYKIRHFYDVWHITKSVKKKIVALGNRKDCEAVNEWCKSIINHMYWAAASTPDGNPDVILEKYLSVVNHVQNIHTGHEGTHFTECAHPPLQGERPRKWLTPNSEPLERLTEILCATRLKNDVKKMSPKQQTSSVEAFHALINYFAPKLTVFSYAGMKSRLLIAAMHYNENSGREAATSKSGEKLYRISFPRGKAGDYVIREKTTEASFGYVEDLMEEMVKTAELDNNPAPHAQVVPPPLSSSFRHPSLEDALLRQSSRFSRNDGASTSGCLQEDTET